MTNDKKRGFTQGQKTALIMATVLLAIVATVAIIYWILGEPRPCAGFLGPCD